MSKYDFCVPSVMSTASTVTITTKDAALHGVVAVAGATATIGSIVIHAVNATGNTVFAMQTVTSGGTISDGPFSPVVCAGGIYAVCTGTAFNFTVLFTEL